MRGLISTLAAAALTAAGAGAVPSPGAPAATPEHRYAVTVDPGLRALTVRACFDGTPPRRLESGDREAAELLTSLRLPGGRPGARPEGRVLRLGTLPAEACVDYRVALVPPAGAPAGWRGGGPRRVGEDVLIAPGRWLWRPAADATLEIVFDLPEGVAVSVPWTLLERRAGHARFRARAAAERWNAATAFGRFEVAAVPVAGTRLRIAVLDGDPAPDPAAMRRWLHGAAMAAGRLYGHIPVPELQVLVVPTPPAGEAVPFAEVLRGGAPALRFFVDPRYPLADYLGDWTAVHELAHLFHPRFGDGDLWLAEGLASYYQNVLQARHGMLTPKQAWAELHAGFTRGSRDTRGLPLAVASERMHRDRAYMRVYWSGAAVALLADLRLREASGGTRSLDTALAAFGDCCLPSDRPWSARAFMAKLDELTGSDVFGALLESHGRSRRFPDVSGALRRLGVGVREGRVHLLEHAPARAHRDAIMGAG